MNKYVTEIQIGFISCRKLQSSVETVLNSFPNNGKIMNGDNRRAHSHSTFLIKYIFLNDNNNIEQLECA